MSGTLAELIARLESASEGSQALDIEIVRVIGWTCLAEKQDNDACRFAVKAAHDSGDWRGINWDDDKGRPRGDCRAWPLTTSIDAALTLVPEGYAIDHFQIWPGEPSRLNVYATRQSKTGAWVHHGGAPIWEAKAATPALAIVIAALRARETQV